MQDDDYAFKTNDIFSDNLKINTLNINLANYESPSGKNNYSLIKILGSLLKYAKQNNIKIDNKFSDFYLIIDEPEKFCHPNLIKKVGIFLNEISNYINVILTTHSPLFLSYYVNNEKTNIFFHNGEEFKNFKISMILKKLKFNTDKLIYRVLNNKSLRINFFDTLFSPNVLLLEDETTNSFLNIIYDQTKIFNWSNLITFGWNNIDDFINFYLKIGVKKEKLKIVVDSDSGKKGCYKETGKYNDLVIYYFQNEIEKELKLSCNHKSSASNLILKDNLNKTNAWIKIIEKIIN